MLGAVFGDIVGSAYEWNNVKTKDFPLQTSFTRYTDDSVMTLAVAQWLMTDPDHSEEGLVREMKRLGRGHFKAGYGGRFKAWLMSSEPQPYNSWGNGSAMRVSPVALYAISLEETLELARTTAIVTHSHPEGIKGALSVAECVFICKEAKCKPSSPFWRVRRWKTVCGTRFQLVAILTLSLLLPVPFMLLIKSGGTSR